MQLSAKAVGLIVLGVALAALALWFGWDEINTVYRATLRFVFEQQRDFSRSLNRAVLDLKKSQDGALFSLVSLGFAYGIFHALGPGHGKAVISAYALTHQTQARRTVALAFASALIQGLSAIAVVGVLTLLVEGGVRRFATSADDVLEIVSYACVTAIGAYLLRRGYVAWRASRQSAAPHDRGHTHDHDHDDACGCGHAHVPSATQVAEADSLGKAAIVALSVGIRPCTGAILVLVLAIAFGFTFSGIAAVLAMSFGTALTVSSIAVGSQSLRRPLQSLVNRLGGGARFGAGLMAAGGVVIMILGAALISDALNHPAHPFY